LALALLGAAIFKTNPINETAPNLTNTIHTVCGALVILTFPIIATIVAFTVSAAVKPGFLPLLVITTVLNWLGQMGFFASISISQKMNPEAGRVGPEVYLGWPNRMMVLLYVIWMTTTSVVVSS